MRKVSKMPTRTGDTVTDLIPAAPGWYALYNPGDDSNDGDLIPVIAWQPGTDDEGNDVLLPVLADFCGVPPRATSADHFAELNIELLYRPNHDPAAH
jgi:hypothetical protein